MTLSTEDANEVRRIVASGIREYVWYLCAYSAAAAAFMMLGISLGMLWLS